MQTTSGRSQVVHFPRVISRTPACTSVDNCRLQDAHGFHLPFRWSVLYNLNNIISILSIVYLYVLSFAIVAVVCPKFLADCADSMDLANWISPEHRLHSRATNNTRYLVSQEFSVRDRAKSKYSTWQRLLSRRRGFNLRHSVWACITASHTHVLRKHSGNNTLQ